LRVGELPGGELLNGVPGLDGRRFVVRTTRRRQSRWNEPHTPHDLA